VRMRALKANDWLTPMSEELKAFRERCLRFVEALKEVAPTWAREPEKYAKELAWMQELLMAMHRSVAEAENKARDALASGTHFIFDRVRLHRGIVPEDQDRLLNKRGRRLGEDLQFEEEIDCWSFEIVVLRKEEASDGQARDE